MNIMHDYPQIDFFNEDLVGIFPVAQDLIAPLAKSLHEVILRDGTINHDTKEAAIALSMTLKSFVWTLEYHGMYYADMIWLPADANPMRHMLTMPKRVCHLAWIMLRRFGFIMRLPCGSGYAYTLNADMIDTLDGIEIHADFRQHWLKYNQSPVEKVNPDKLTIKDEGDDITIAYFEVGLSWRNAVSNGFIDLMFMSGLGIRHAMIFYLIENYQDPIMVYMQLKAYFDFLTVAEVEDALHDLSVYRGEIVANFDGTIPDSYRKRLDTLLSPDMYKFIDTTDKPLRPIRSINRNGHGTISTQQIWESR